MKTRRSNAYIDHAQQKLRMKIILTIYLTFLLNISFSQVKFETTLRYKIAWGNNLLDEYREDIEENKSTVNFSELIKNDNKYLESSENVLVDFIFKNLEEGNLVGLSRIGGDTLNKRQIHEKIHWKWDIDNHHGDTIRWINIEELQYFKIYQEWEIDTIRNSISNKIVGISILKEEDKKEIQMLYVPFKNRYASEITNDPKIVYIRHLNSKHDWKTFPKKTIAKLLTKTDDSFLLLENSNNPLNIHNG